MGDKVIGESLWKPFLRRSVTGHWRRMRLVPGEVAPPSGLNRPGLYIHVPFCRNLCPFCPYNRFQYEPEAFRRFERALRQEFDLIEPHLRGVEFHSLYIGGGTPTVDMPGLARILSHFREGLGGLPETCIELHPGEMSDDCLETLHEAGVSMVSIGAQSLSDELLARIGRSHDGSTARAAIRRASAAGFRSVNVDLMFALPGQTLAAWEDDVCGAIDAGADQISTYPLFGFPYSESGERERLRDVRRPPTSGIRRMLSRTDDLARNAGFLRCAVWSWIRPGGRKFSSVSRHHYVGFGPSAASMTGECFQVNTFFVNEYADALPERRPVALSMKLDRRQEMAYWLYWRIYELFAEDRDFSDLFDGADLGNVFGTLFLPFRATGMLRRTDDGYVVTDAGAFWIHRLQNEFSLAYITRLWGDCRRNPWPGPVLL